MNFSGVTCLVTGASSGLGLEVTRQLAGLGGHVVMLCRSRDTGEAALQSVTNASPEARVDLMICDLSSMKSIGQFLKEFPQRCTKLDILFNNAAVMKQRRTVTEDGFETMFQVNYLAAFILMTRLVDQLRHGTNPCIINNAAPADKYRLDLEDLQFERDYSMFDSFMETKLCLHISGLELARRPESRGITVTSVAPGVFRSRLVRESPLRGWLKNLFSAPVERVAENILYHMSNRTQDQHGRVFIKKVEKELTEHWKDRSVAGRLWSITESMTAEMNQERSAADEQVRAHT